MLKELKLYLSSLKSEGKSEKTIKDYERGITKWFEFANIKTFEDIKTISSLDINSYVAHLDDRGLSSNTKFTYTICIKAFYTYLIENKMVQENPVKIKIKVKTMKEAIFLSSDEVAQFLSVCKKKRDKALFVLVFELGLRYSEYSSIKIGDIREEKDDDFVYYTLRVVGKGDKKRSLGFSSDTYSLIDDYIKNERPKQFDTDLLFVTANGKKISNKEMNAITKSLAKKAGFPNWQKFHCHTTRHSFASMKVESGDTNMKELQAMMGHTNITTTANIYSHISEKNLVKKMAHSNLGLAKRTTMVNRDKDTDTTSSQEPRSTVLKSGK